MKQDFKQKENKYLADFLNMKFLKEKVEDKLVKQDQSLQTVHMLCRPRPLYNEQNKVAIGYKNPLCLTRAKQVQPALYNGHEILKDNHAPAKVHNTEDTLEIDEITRKKMNAKMTDPECVTHKGKDNAIRQLKKQLSKLQVTRSDTEHYVRHLKESVETIREIVEEAKFNNRDAHLDYVRHLKESVETIRDIVEEAKVVRPLDRSIVSACHYTKHYQELLEYAIGTYPQGSQQRAKQLANTPLIRKKQDSNKQVHVVAVKPQKTNVPVPPSTGRTYRPLVFGFRLLKTYDGGSLTALEFCKKVHR
nr:hypothetical protein [Tanacetum cinerariifolium]